MISNEIYRKQTINITFGITILTIILFSGGARALSNPGNGSWQYFRDITINNSGNELNDYQVLINLTGSAFPINAQIDGDDLRFTDLAGNELYYWMESYNSTNRNAKVWVYVSNIPGHALSTIQMHYGNQNAESSSNGDATFEIFDEFNGINMDETKWEGIVTETGVIFSVSNGYVEILGTKLGQCGQAGGIHSIKTIQRVNTIIESRWQVQDTEPGRIGQGFRNLTGESKNIAWAWDVPCWSNQAGWILETPSGANAQVSCSYFPGSIWHIGKFITSLNSTSYYQDDILISSKEDQTINNTLPVRVFTTHWCDGYARLDWIRVRKFTSFEPSIIVGAETQASVLVGEWHFDGNAFDSSGSGNHGTINGSTFVQGVSGQALGLDGVDDYVDMGNVASLNPTSAITIETWVNFNSLNATQYFISKPYTSAFEPYHQYGLIALNTSKINLALTIGDIRREFSTSQTIAAAQWYHIVGTYDGSVMKLYINGTQDPATLSVSGDISTYSTNLTIGRWSPGPHFFNGIVDEVRLYNRALNASEIKAHYDALAPTPITSVPTGTVIRISDAATGINSSVTSSIMIENVTNLAAVTVELTYNTNMVNVLTVYEVDLGAVTVNTDNNAGKTTITAFSNTGKSGNVTFANVVLKAVGSINDTTPLNLTVRAISDQNTSAIPYSIKNGTFTILAVSKGDVNGDGQVNVIDALLISQYTVGMRTFTLTQLAVADVNGDGNVTIVDALFLAQYTVGLRQL